jgi:hypothetical protein
MRTYILEIVGGLLLAGGFVLLFSPLPTADHGYATVLCGGVLSMCGGEIRRLRAEIARLANKT